MQIVVGLAAVSVFIVLLVWAWRVNARANKASGAAKQTLREIRSRDDERA